MGLLVKLAANGVGLAAEAREARKQRKAHADLSAEPASSSSTHQVSDPKGSVPPTHLGSEILELPGTTPKVNQLEPGSDDEEAWACDDAAASVGAQVKPESKPKYGIDAQPTIQSLTDQLLEHCPPPTAVTVRLPLPVILPQRRPGNKQRGFIHAFAPVLEAQGIDQATFLNFVETFHTATQASPILKVVFLSGGVAGFVPSVAAQITSAAVQASVGTAMEIQRRQRTNTFLDEVNDRLFKPRGLYALILAHKPGQQTAYNVQTLDIDSLISKREEKNASTLTGGLKSTVTTTHHDLELPEAAPLVFPELDQVAESGDNARFAGIKSANKFLADYYDRRAQATYAANNVNSSLNLPEEQKPKFASKFSDPNDPVHNGSLVTLLTGGKVNPREMLGVWGRREARRDARRERRSPSREHSAQGEGAELSARQRAQEYRPLRMARRKMKQGVLYLMIVNLPTQEEVTTAQQALYELA